MFKLMYYKLQEELGKSVCAVSIHVQQNYWADNLRKLVG